MTQTSANENVKSGDLDNIKKGVLMGPASLEEQLAQVREELTEDIAFVKELADNRPRSGAEITLALRALQTARMWLGVAEAMEKGLDPWANKVEEKK